MIVVRYADDSVLGFENQRDAERKKEKGLGKPETFDFLGFTHYCGMTRKNGKFMVWRKTSRKRLNSKIKEIRQTLLRLRHKPVREIARWLTAVMKGHMNYFSVPGNGASVNRFLWEQKRAWFAALCRRSQRKRVNWEKFGKYLDPMLPKFQVAHPYPQQRFYAKYSR